MSKGHDLANLRGEKVATTGGDAKRWGMHTYAEGEITLAGIRLTLAEWEALDQEDRHLLLQLAVAGEGDETLAPAAVRIPAMIDLLARAS